MALDIRRLKHFVAAAEHGNINRAAESLYITQSALTRSIQVLEEDLGAKLFERTPRGVTLTAFGKRLFDHARRIINTTSIAQADMAALINGAGGEIRIGITPTLTSPSLMNLLFSLPRTMPMLAVSITEMFYDSLIQLLRLGELDMVISTLPEGSDRSDLNVEQLVQGPVRMSVVMRKNHPLRAMKAITPEALQQANWVATSQNHYLASLTRYFTDKNMQPPTFRLYANSMSILLRAVLQEDFVALLSEATIERDFPPDSVVCVPDSTQITTRRVGLIYAPNAIRSAAFLRLSQSITQHYKEEAAALRAATAT
ncbi:LysR family transcriptional regulator [Povalibacter sp.]|uniref:LysR family transcriptional regulator n=1 Tax=Povalibacter sp. TaxID=1962978 RepID=UPI002F3F5092